MYEQNARCASVHLVSSLHSKCALEFLAYRIKQGMLFSAFYFEE